MERNTTFTEGKILQPLILFAMPVLFALFLQAMYGAVDLLVVGKFAFSADVSAVSTGSQIMMTLTNLISSFAMGTTVLLGQLIGCGKKEEGGKAVGTAMVMFAGIALVMTVLLVCFAPQISSIMHAPKEAFDKTAAYVRICGCGMIVIVAYNLYCRGSVSYTHLDLGRNDLGKISKFGSVKVEKLHSIERYSHVMHIGSTVRGEIDEKHDALDAIEAVLPAGTLSGAPKIRACQLIGELENNKRSIYGGAIGYIDFTGNMDTCIAIRIAYRKNGKVFVRSGAGIVADSDPKKEFEECLNKARAALKALEMAQEEEL